MHLLFVVLAACSSPSEPPKASPPPAAPPAAAPPVAPPHEHEGPTDAALPAGYTAAVAELRTHQATIAGLLSAGKLADIHPEAEAVMKLATALPAQATDLTPAAKADVTLKALDVKKKADELHDKADEGDAAGAKAAFDAMTADIEALGAVK